MKTVWARRNQPTTLPCELDAEGPEQETALEWRRNGTLIFNAFGAEAGFSAPEFQGRLARAPHLGLTIHSVRPEDQSLFVCSITRFPKGSPIGAKESGALVRLIVHSFPRIVAPSDGQRIFVRENGTFKQNCAAEGIPTPGVRWKRNRNQQSDNWDLELVQEGPQLTIDSFTAEHEGEYICEADNFEGRTESAISLRLRKPLRIGRDNASMVNKTAEEGASVFWHCAVEEPGRLVRERQVRLRWTRDGAPLGGQEIALRAHVNNGEFGIMRLKRTDSGAYVCEASYLEEGEHQQVETDSLTVHLDVQYRPEISTRTRRFHTVVAGTRVDLDCLVEANPAPTHVRWTRNGRELQRHSETQIKKDLWQSRVHISAASQHSDAGIYTCEAQNAVGTSAPLFEIHVVVAEQPQFTKVPAPQYHVRAGEAVQIECEGFAEVPVRRIWTRNGKSLFFPDDRFEITNVSHGDHGTYRCTLLNSVATLSREVQLFVDSTFPQCVSQVRVECLGAGGLWVRWVPGYPGGEDSPQQLFRVFLRQAKQSPTEWTASDLTNHAGLRLQGLQPFGLYELKVEASNRYGEVNCTLPGWQHTCTQLAAPSNLRLNFVDSPQKQRQLPVLSWDSVAEAKTYKVKYRRAPNPFREIVGIPPLWGPTCWNVQAEVSDPFFELPVERLQLAQNSCCFEFVVQSVRLPFNASGPSNAVSFPHIAGASLAPVFLLIAAGGLFSLLLLCLMLCFLKRHYAKVRIVTKCDKLPRTDYEFCQVVGDSEEKLPFDRSNQFCSSSRCASTSTATSAAHAYCAFGHPVAITRKLFPDNYICTKMAEFDEDDLDLDEGGQEGQGLREGSLEQFGHFPSSEAAAFVENSDGGRGSLNSEREGRSRSYVEMKTAEQRSVVDEMLRHKYIIAQTEDLNALEQVRIEQLRQELSSRCTRIP